MSDYPEPTQWNGDDVWETRTQRRAGGGHLTGARRLEADISLLLLYLATADPLARFWAMHAMRTARGMGLVQ